MDRKFRDVRKFVWPNDGHQLTIYVNGYLNVHVRADKFQDYVAAGLEAIAKELRSEAAEERGRFLQAQIQADTSTVMPSPEEEREAKRTEKEVDREIAKQEKQDAATV